MLKKARDNIVIALKRKVVIFNKIFTMGLVSNLQLMSQYNQWMNQKIYQQAQQLREEEIEQERGAFFGSILGTLNHIYVADIIWLRRFAKSNKPYSSLARLPELNNYTDLKQTVADDLITLWELRQKLDKIIINWCKHIDSQDLEQNLQYTDTKGNPYHKNLGQLVHHFFNHQTHHRGQVSTLLSQQGIDLGVTDLLAILPEQIG